MPAIGKSPLESVAHFVLAPLAVGVVIALTSRGTEHQLDAGILSFVIYLGAALLFSSESRWANLLPFMRLAYGAAAPLAGLAAVMLLKATTSVPGAGRLPLVAGTLAGAAISVAPRIATRHRRRKRAVRLALIGSVSAAERLARDLEVEGPPTYHLVGRISLDEEPAADGAREKVRRLAPLSEVDKAVIEERLDLLVVTDEAPRPRVFDRLAESCLRLSVRVCGLTGFYEDLFGRVPVSELNAAWFQYLMHPRYRPTPSVLKRGLDVCVAGVVVFLTLPLLAVLALLTRLDGGPAFFRQSRVGEGGRLFTVYKLRTMRVASSSAAQWASPADPRITPIGAILRRTHLDELPQVFNVLRGEMSLVGPRPEQPVFVAHLEKSLPFYTQRHLVRPGITGWAQVRCGYAGSDIGSTRKLCHDLFYLKHRTLLLDFVIIGETLRTLIADRQFATKPPDDDERPAPHEPRLVEGGEFKVATLALGEAGPGEREG
jgi:exopolysaccharide biosynthesis polyprenyl glycosylphosphotransferase